ncbi:MAG: rod shape-determining protein MreD [Pseudomonadota bacterium]
MHRLLAAVGFVAVALLLMMVQMVPAPAQPENLPGPDLVLALTLAWVGRSPQTLPVILIACVLLAADLLLQYPPGLGAALGVIAAEVLRRHILRFRTRYFPAEWSRAALLIFAVGLGHWIILGLTFSPQPVLGDIVLRAMFTAAAYPVFVGALSLCGLRAEAPA